jgi:hypothetical protein
MRLTETPVKNEIDSDAEETPKHKDASKLKNVLLISSLRVQSTKHKNEESDDRSSYPNNQTTTQSAISSQKTAQSTRRTSIRFADPSPEPNTPDAPPEAMPIGVPTSHSQSELLNMKFKLAAFVSLIFSLLLGKYLMGESKWPRKRIELIGKVNSQVRWHLSQIHNREKELNEYWKFQIVFSTSESNNSTTGPTDVKLSSVT